MGSQAPLSAPSLHQYRSSMELGSRPLRPATIAGSHQLVFWLVFLDLLGHQGTNLTTKPGKYRKCLSRVGPGLPGLLSAPTIPLRPKCH